MMVVVVLVVVVELMVMVGEGVVVALLVFQFLPYCCPKVNPISPLYLFFIAHL